MLVLWLMLLVTKLRAVHYLGMDKLKNTTKTPVFVGNVVPSRPLQIKSSGVLARNRDVRAPLSDPHETPHPERQGCPVRAQP